MVSVVRLMALVSILMSFAVWRTELGRRRLAEGFIAQLDGALDQRGDGVVAEAASMVACIVKELFCLGPKPCGVLVE